DQTIGNGMRERTDIPPDILRSALTKVAARAAERSRKMIVAQRVTTELKEAGRLDGERVANFAREEKYEEVVAALAVLSSLKYELIENMMYPQRIGGI